GEELSDTLVRTVPVRPWALEFLDQRDGVSRGDATASVALPADCRKRRQTLAITVGPSSTYGRFNIALDDYELTILVNGKEFQTLVSRGNSQEVSFVVPGQLVSQTENTVDFRLYGHGEFAYSVTLRGSSTNLGDLKSWASPYIRSRRYYHVPLVYRGQSIGVDSSTQVKNIEIGQRVQVQLAFGHSNSHQAFHGETVVEEFLPTGFVLVRGSLTGSHSRHAIDGNRITMVFPAGRDGLHDVSYQIVGDMTGDYLVLPTVIRDTSHSLRMRIGMASALRVLAPGERTTDSYTLNNEERFTLGRLKLSEGDFGGALPYFAGTHWQELICDFLTRSWPQSEQAHDVLMVLGKIHASGNQPEKAAFYFSRVPANSPRYAEAQLTAGRGYAAAYRNAEARPGNEQPSPARKQTWLDRSATHMQTGIASLKQETPGDRDSPQLRSAKTSLAKTLVKRGEYGQTLELLTGRSPDEGPDTDRRTGRLAIEAENRDVQPEPPGYLSAAYARKLMAAYSDSNKNIAAGKAMYAVLESMFGAAFAEAARQGDDVRAEELEKEIARLKGEKKIGKLEDVLASYEEVLGEAGVEAKEAKFGPTNWAAESYTALGAGLDDDQGRSEQYFESGSKLFDTIISRGEADPHFVPGGNVDGMRLKLANCRFRQGKHSAALGNLKDLVKNGKGSNRAGSLKRSKQALKALAKDSAKVPDKYKSQYNELYRTMQQDLGETEIADLTWPPVRDSGAERKVAETAPDETPKMTIGDPPGSESWSPIVIWIVLGILLVGGGYSWLRVSGRTESSVDDSVAASATLDVESRPLRKAYARLIRRIRSAPKPEKARPAPEMLSATRSSSGTTSPAAQPAGEASEQTVQKPKVDEFQLTDRIATTKFTRTYSAQGPGGAIFTVKLLAPKVRNDPHHISLLRHEARVTGSLTHPNLVKFHKIVVSKTQAYIVLDHFPSGNVKELLTQDLSAVQVQLPQLIDPLCLAVAHMHDSGWIHRGLKPDNLLIDNNGEMKLIGLSLCSRRVRGLRRLFAGKPGIAGTRTYIAPETLQRRHATPQTDMYSLGVTIFELLTGEPPFDAASPKELLEKHMHEPPPPPSQILRNVGPDMDRLVQRLLEKKPQNRHKSMREVIAEFRAAKIWKEDIQQYLQTEQEYHRRMAEREASRRSPYT
ncbi:MAG: serine/threonine-protein kinase, partial [Planctomycetaceae bacterium]